MQTFRLRQFEYATKNLKFSAIFKQILNVLNSYTECKLELHPIKTKLVYCQDKKRSGDHVDVRFDFLGFSFHARTVQDRYGKLFTSFSPAVSRKALKRMNESIRNLDLYRNSTLTLRDLAVQLNPMVRGGCDSKLCAKLT